MHFHFYMTPSWHGNAFRITAFLWGGSTGHQWIPLTKGQWCPFYVFFVVVPRSYLTNTRIACDLRRPDAHVMLLYERCRPVTAKCTPTNIGQFIISRWVTWLEFDMFNSPPTHTPEQNKMATISQTIYSDAFSWMKSFVVWSKFHWGVFLKVQLAIYQHWFR